MNRLIQLNKATAVFFVLLGLGCFCLSLTAQAQLPSPAPDGSYPNNNTAEGGDALLSVTVGRNNTAVGFGALHFNTTGSTNTANGFDALSGNTIGNENTANGAAALASNIEGSQNTAIGAGALAKLGAGNRNIALGYQAGSDLAKGSHNIYIANLGTSFDESTIRLGSNQMRTFIAGISGVAVAGAQVVVDAAGQLGVTASSVRFKDGIKPMENTSEAILALKPVTFRYKKEIDSDGTPQFGLVAEDVEKVNPDLVVRDAKGKPFTVRYEAVNAMLLNEFLKEHRKVEKLEATVAQQHKDFDAAVAELKGQIQKVSAQLELNKPAPQTVQNNR